MPITITPGYTFSNGATVTPTRLNQLISGCRFAAGANVLLGVGATAGDVAEIACTSAGRDLLAASTASAQRSLLGACAADDARLSNARTPTAHGHSQDEVTGLAAALAGKSAAGHGHAIADVSGLTEALAAAGAPVEPPVREVFSATANGYGDVEITIFNQPWAVHFASVLVNTKNVSWSSGSSAYVVQESGNYALDFNTALAQIEGTGGVVDWHAACTVNNVIHKYVGVKGVFDATPAQLSGHLVMPLTAGDEVRFTAYANPENPATRCAIKAGNETRMSIVKL